MLSESNPSGLTFRSFRGSFGSAQDDCNKSQKSYIVKKSFPNQPLFRCNSSNPSNLLTVTISDYPTPQTLGPPDACAQTLQLHDLTVIDKQIHSRSVILDVPCKYIGIGGFEHQFVHADLIDKFCRHIRAPRIHTLGDSFAFDHDDFSAGVQKSLCLGNRPTRIACAFCLQFRSCCCAAS